ncbi:MAG: hypothetical protein JWM27_86 [Gemmatimonadetes bacterium]|nr:hypothetical protein [Gemmatimonadota bacterium]
MTKKPVPDETPDAVVPPVAGPESAAHEPATAVDRWTADTWHGLPHHACAACPFDTLEGEAAIRLHVARAHPTL